MEAALLSGFIKAIVPKLHSLATEEYKLHKGVKNDMNFLARELRMIVAAIDDELSAQTGDQGAVPRLSIEELRELAHGIEDCIDNFMYWVAWKQHHRSFISRRMRSLLNIFGHRKLAEEMRRLRKSAEETYQRKERYTAPGRQLPAAASSMPLSDPRILDMDLLGMDGPREELLEQLAEVEGQPQQLKMLAIVGFCGLGKTALAAQVYNRVTGDGGFERHAWVCAADKSPAEVLADLLRILLAGVGSFEGTSDIGRLCADLREQLNKKRYFIVIDDIRTEDQWRSVKLALPDSHITSRILVTTTIKSVANACRSADGYVHKMSRLDKECSKKLFSKKACPQKYLYYEPPDSTEILKKCDGQPLALVTIGEFLKRKDWPMGHCEDVCNKLHYHMKNDDIFGAMHGVLNRNYTALPGHALKACLLYFGMFPSHHPIRTKSLQRRWLAEGFVEPQPSGTTPDPANNFEKLMDRNMIEPITVSNNKKEKTCQTFGMMHEYILHKAIDQNFVTLSCDDKIEPRYIRRLALHNSTVTDAGNLDTVDLSLVRSLTIFGEASGAILKFNKYKLLRVLDLEKCDCLKDDHLKKIYSLLLLKYLSLGGNVTRLTRDVAKLKELEVLDLRRTNVNILPVEVFQMPCLVHLFGKFKLPNQWQSYSAISGWAEAGKRMCRATVGTTVPKRTLFQNPRVGPCPPAGSPHVPDKVKPKCEVLDFLSEGKSNLQTLAGFVADGTQCFLHLIGYMKKLRKLKIWWEPSAGADSTTLTDLQETVQQFVKDEKNASAGPRSLSLHFDKCSEDFLNSIQGPCYLSSLKLHGKLSTLPEFIVSLRGLKELCLSSAKLPKGLLEALSKLSYLKYLKLIADELEKITIKDKEFPRLVSLCFELQRPKIPTIEKGSMPFLITLQLLCKDIDGLSDIKIEYLTHLEEIILDHRVAPGTRDEWKRAAKEHPNRPKVLSTKMTAAAKSELTEDSIALEQNPLKCTEIAMASKGSVQETDTLMLVNEELEPCAAKKEQNSCAVQSSSDDGLNSASTTVGRISDVGPFPESSEMADAQNILPEDGHDALELAKTRSTKYSVASNGSLRDTDTQM